VSLTTRYPCGEARAAERIRTADPFITSEVLYQLSYGGEARQARRPRRHGWYRRCRRRAPGDAAYLRMLAEVLYAQRRRIAERRD